MQRIKTQTNINQLLQAIPETTQETICGGSTTSCGVNTMFLDGSVKFVGSSLSSNVASTSGGPYYTGSVTVSDDG
ncbi:H-X9-DG-CTERM domain-containing protein [Leptolyngbya sp. Cla-17]|uniref:H-X9-DG-CTERM domain-containing protein n=1 Tax=Leptolyngbya sp. Cla-17 TaxID=2803751 RepID=UPI0039F4F7FB